MPAESSPLASRATTRTPATSRDSSPLAEEELIALLAIFIRSSSASRRAFFNSSCNRSTCVASSVREVRRPDVTRSRIVSASRKRSKASTPVTALMRRTPEAIDSSLVILNKPMSPVARTCVPPQSSFEKMSSSPFAPLMESTRTFSPYFSPKSAIAPERIASSVAISFVWTGSLRRMW